jgi:hypothetical protein
MSLELLTLIQNTQDLISFVEGDGLIEALEAIGDVALTAAQAELRNASYAYKPEDRIKAAVVHLGTAQIAFHKAYGSSISQQPKWEHAPKDAYACCLLAVCYQYLGEPLLRDQYLEKARRAYYDSLVSHEDGLTLSFALTTMKIWVNLVNPVCWYKAVAAYFDPLPDIDSSDIEKLGNRLRNL